MLRYSYIVYFSRKRRLFSPFVCFTRVYCGKKKTYFVYRSFRLLNSTRRFEAKAIETKRLKEEEEEEEEGEEDDWKRRSQVRSEA